MLEVPITPQMVEKARAWDAEMGQLANSITGGEGNIAGYVGKYLVSGLLGVPLTKTYNYDMVFKRYKVEVKTKRCTSPPKMSYECSIAAFNPRQSCDLFVFTRVMKDLSRGWVLGCLSPLDYFRLCVKHEAGEHDPENGFTFHCRTFNVPIKKLSPIDTLLHQKEEKPAFSLDSFS